MKKQSFNRDEKHIVSRDYVLYCVTGSTGQLRASLVTSLALNACCFVVVYIYNLFINELMCNK